MVEPCNMIIKFSGENFVQFGYGASLVQDRHRVRISNCFIPVPVNLVVDLLIILIIRCQSELRHVLDAGGLQGKPTSL